MRSRKRESKLIHDYSRCSWQGSAVALFTAERINKVPDPIRIEPHPESEHSYHELREQFRAENLERVRSLLNDYRINGVKMKLMGQPMALEGATTPEARAKLLLSALDSPVTQDFGLEDIPADLCKQLDDLVDKCSLSEQVTWAEGTEGVVDHDAPALPVPVDMLTDDELCKYVDQSIEESKNG
jgi:hypothetical protein